jgi:hypothetical protein
MFVLAGAVANRFHIGEMKIDETPEDNRINARESFRRRAVQGKQKVLPALFSRAPFPGLIDWLCDGQTFQHSAKAEALLFAHRPS